MGRRRRWLTQRTVSAVTDKGATAAQLWTRCISRLAVVTKLIAVRQKKFRTEWSRAASLPGRIVYAGVCAFITEARILALLCRGILAANVEWTTNARIPTWKLTRAARIA